MKEITGDVVAQGFKFAFVVARFNELIGERLLEGALDTFQRHGGDLENALVIRVPGAYEIPLATKKITGKVRNRRRTSTIRRRRSRWISFINSFEI